MDLFLICETLLIKWLQRVSLTVCAPVTFLRNMLFFPPLILRVRWNESICPFNGKPEAGVKAGDNTRSNETVISHFYTRVLKSIKQKCLKSQFISLEERLASCPLFSVCLYYSFIFAPEWCQDSNFTPWKDFIWSKMLQRENWQGLESESTFFPNWPFPPGFLLNPESILLLTYKVF